VYEVGARKNRLSFLKERVVNKLTGKSEKVHAEAHVKLLEVARKAAAKTRKKSSIVSVAPELEDVEIEDLKRPAVPAGRKSLRVVN